MKKAVGFGDFLLRLSPPGYQRFLQASSFDAFYTGAEANVLAALSLEGVPAEFVTRLPENLIGECALAHLRRFGVGTGGIARGGERIGVFYLEKGASQRPSRVVYDRRHTAFSESSPADYDWDAILDGAGWFHLTGITPALGPALPDICREACEAARARGVPVSLDLNYRSQLWDLETAGRTLRSLAPLADVLMGGVWDASALLGSPAPDGPSDTPEANERAARALAERYGFRDVAFTMRRGESASDNGWRAMLFRDGQAYFSREYEIRLVDRVGGGDAFAAGLIGASLRGCDAQRAVEYAAAAGCLKQTIEQDFNLSSHDEIEALAAGDGTGRIRR
jgi:2-dehydro-3-deoxygluconokinase